MTHILAREPVAGAITSGLLLAEHFQMAYVTTDMNRACDLFRENFGIGDFTDVGGALPEGGEFRACFAWVGTLMYEIVWAGGPGSAIYMDCLGQTEDFALKHHHLGYLIEDEDQWEAVPRNAARQNWAVPYRAVNPQTEFCYVDVPALGHYLEYIRPTPLGVEFFTNVPRS